MKELEKKSKKAKIIIVLLVLLADIFLLPWLLQLPKLLATNILTAKDVWLDIGVINSIQILISDIRLIKVYAWLQLLVLALIIAIITYGMKHNKNKTSNEIGQPEAAGGGEFGTSRWQTNEEIEKNLKIWETNKEIEKGGTVLGIKKITNTKSKFYIKDDDLHTLIIGATGSGKTRTIIHPTIWELANAGESMVLGDPKGELYIGTKDYLKSKGYNVIALDLKDPQLGNQWNILDSVNKAVKDGDIRKASSLSRSIANILSANSDGSRSIGGDEIWTLGASSIINALILITAMESDFEKQKNMATVYHLLETMCATDKNGNTPLIKYINSLDLNHPARVAFTTAKVSPEKMKASFFGTIASKLAIFADEEIADMTSKQDHVLEETGINKTAVFLIIPHEDSTNNVLATLYIDQLYQALVKLSDKHGGRVPRRVNYILDEFGNLPTLPEFTKKLTIARGLGIRFTIAIQGIDQLKRLYRNDVGTILGNCNTWIYLSTGDPDTLKLISEKTGKYTIETENQSSGFQSSRTESFSSNYGQGLTGRALLMSDEVERWNYENYSLVLVTGKYPSKLPLTDLSLTPANKDFGFVEPTNNWKNDRDKNLEIIMKRWEMHKIREKKDVIVWLPNIMITNENKENENEKEEKYIENKENINVNNHEEEIEDFL